MAEYVEGYGDPGRKKDRISKFNVAAIIGIPLAAVLFQFVVPRVISYLSFLELPLLVTVYFSMMRRSPMAGVLFGAGIGLAQDSVSRGYVGMYGIVKTLVGYFAATVSQRFDVENAWARLILSFFFYCFHQFFYWVLKRALIGETMHLDPVQTIVYAALNAVVAVPLFRTLDRLKIAE